MAYIKPFRGLRPIPEKISEIASPPYDVLNSEEARAKVQGNPYSFLHVVKPEIDLDPDIDVYDPKVYTKGGENLRKMIQDKVIQQDDAPCFYVYKLRMGDHVQVGLVAVASVEDYVQNHIKKHEFTRPDKENDRMTHIDSLNAQAGPVFLTYRESEKINNLIRECMTKEPVYDFKGDYDVQHTFFVVDKEELIQNIQNAFSKIPALYVADGHHRSAAAARVRDARMKANPNHTGEEEYNFFLTVIFPDSQMQILDYNRVVQDLNGLSFDTFMDKVSEKFDVEQISMCCAGCSDCNENEIRPSAPHTFTMYIKGQWYKLTAKEGSFNANDPIKQLDVSILQENLLSPILGIQNPRTDKRIHFVGGIRGLGELEKLVKNREYEVAFAFYPTSIHQLLSVADANQVMPPKSTWFEPKLASGVVVHMLDE